MATELRLLHFAVLDLAKTHLSNAIILRCPTNNPCHLACYYTDRKPGRHRQVRLIRGLALPWGAYWCFVGWKWVPQVEPGDTLIHTFVVPDWTIYHTQWFAFRGSVGGLLSPSCSPILKHQHTGLNLVLNPSFEDWSAPSGDAPDHWEYPPGPHHNVLYPDDDIKFDRHYSCRIDNPTPTGNFRIHQELSISMLANLPLTFKLAYRGYLHNFNWFRMRVEGSSNYWQHAFPTLSYQWEYLELPTTLPPVLTRLYIQAQNWNQNHPIPFQTWFDNCIVNYTP